MNKGSLEKNWNVVPLEEEEKEEDEEKEVLEIHRRRKLQQE